MTKTPPKGNPEVFILIDWMDEYIILYVGSLFYKPHTNHYLKRKHNYFYKVAILYAFVSLDYYKTEVLFEKSLPLNITVTGAYQ